MTTDDSFNSLKRTNSLKQHYTVWDETLITMKKRKWRDVFMEVRAHPTQTRQWILDNAKRIFVLSGNEPLSSSSYSSCSSPMWRTAVALEHIESPSTPLPPPDVPLTSSIVPTLVPQTGNSSIIKMTDIQHLSNEFPRRCSNDMYQASDFQRALLNHIEHEIIEHRQQMGLIVLSTGLGKTIVATLLLQTQIDRHKKEETLRIFLEKHRSIMDQKSKKPVLIINNSRRRKREALKKKPLFRFLFLVHSKLIRDASHYKFKKHFTAYGFPKISFLNIENQTGCLKQSDLEEKQFIFCLFQSFDKIPEEFVKTKITHVCIDEVHHLIANTYSQVFPTLSTSLIMQSDMSNIEGKNGSIHFILGMTATLHHAEDPQGENLKKMFSNTVYIDLPWALAKKFSYFPSVNYIECVTKNIEYDFETYESLRTQLEEGKISVFQFVSKLENSCKRIGAYSDEQISIRTSANYVCEMHHAFHKSLIEANLPLKRKTIIFAASCSIADDLEILLKQRGYSAASIHYNTNKKLADEALEKFQGGKLQIVINVMMMNEDFDVKDIDCVVLARPTESELVFVQQMGRGLRKSYDSTKENNVTILDICFNLRKRWKRLLKETDNNHLRDLILSFWHVDSFVGMPDVNTRIIKD